ncbi:MAG: fatty acid--CoA ligase family protein [Bacteroidetes bacterium]|nr:fatty acid--CoA ligase family protein [Bacteroidota bacterium]MDA1119612.1 fatty acid--CoA ligase family protein [Bacteroidota bacterium]
MASNLKIFEYLPNYKDDVALIDRGNSHTYNQLLSRIELWDRVLSSYPENCVFAVEGDFSIESVSLIFSLINKRSIIVPLDIKLQQINDEKYEIAAINYIIRIIGDKYDIELVKSEQSDNELYLQLYEENVPGLVLFTSGSSGKPKAAVHNFDKLLKKFETRRPIYVTINFLLFDHWGGLNTMFHILSNGGKLVLLEERSPDYVCKLIEEHQVELLPTSPTFLNMLVASRAYKRHDLTSLRLITYGAEPMPNSLLQLVNKIFPDIKFHQTYGLIELGVLRSKSENNDSLWVKIGGEGYKVRVSNDMLEIKSDSAMIGYLNAPSPFTEDGWFKTGDSVEVKGDYFKILGRKSELINVGGEKVFPQEVENVILEIEEVEDVIVFGEKHPLTGNIVCAKVLLSKGQEVKEIIKAIKMHCRSNLASYKVPIKIQVSNEEIFGKRFKKKRVKS